MSVDSGLSASHTPHQPTEYDGMTVFKPESSFYFTGEPRKRPGVLVTTIILLIMTVGATIAVGYPALRDWFNYSDLVVRGVRGTGYYNDREIDISSTRSGGRYFVFRYTVDNQRYESRHNVLEWKYDDFQANAPVDIVYDPDNPENVQVGDVPTITEASLRSLATVAILLGGSAATWHTMKDYQRSYNANKDGWVIKAIVTEIEPEGKAVRAHYSYKNPLGQDMVQASSTLSPSMARHVQVGASVAALARGPKFSKLL